jgi:hypothetical protein
VQEVRAVPVLVLVAIGLAVVAVFAYGAWAKAKRRKDLATWSRLKGLRYSAGETRVEYRWPQFACLRQGDNRYAYNLMEGDWSGRALSAFDYHYETHSTDSKGNRQTHHHHLSAVVFASGLPLRPLSIRPENLLDKVAAAFGFDDIDFESAEFSRKFCVKSPDRKWAYDVLPARTIEWLLRMPRFHVEFGPGEVIAWRSSTFSVLDFTAAAEVIRHILDGLPDYVIEQQGGAPRRGEVA